MKKKRLEKRTLEENMNDLCPYIFKCREPFCFDKFGNYYNCRRYINDSPRTNSNMVLLYKPDRNI